MADRREQREERKNVPGPRAWAIGVLVFLGVGALLFGGPRLFLKPAEQSTTAEKTFPAPIQTKPYDPSKPVSQVVWRRSVWQPSQQAVALDRKRLGYVGETEEGYAIYAPTSGQTISLGERGYPGEGGGGGKPQGTMNRQPIDSPNAKGPLYLLTGDGRYVELKRLGFAPGGQRHTTQGGPAVDTRPGGR